LYTQSTKENEQQVSKATHY